MNKSEFLNKILQYNDEVCIIIETNEDKYAIEDGGCFIGGIEGTFMCQLLGNICYNDLKSIAIVMYDRITNKFNETIEDVYPY